MSQRTCSIDGCTNPHAARGWCKRHYYIWRRNGDPLIKKSFTDPEEAFAARTEWQGDCLIWVGSRDNSGHGAMRIGGKKTPVHRYAWERSNGTIPEGKVIDHICHNPPCVNVEHLRVATISGNNSHLNGVQRNNRNSGARNVYRARDKFYVRMRKDGQAHYFGVYDTVEEAAVVAEQARKEVFGDFAGRG